MFKKLVEIRNNILISNRLKLILVAISILIISLGIVSINRISKINSKISQINEYHVKNLERLSGLIENIYGILIESHIVDGKSLNENAIENSVNLDLINTYLTEYEQSVIDQTQKGFYDNFLLEFQNYLNILREVNSLQIRGNYQLASEMKSANEYQSYKKLQSIIKSMMAYNIKAINESINQIERLKKNAFYWVLALSFLILLMSISIISLLFKDINYLIKSLTKNLSILHEGQIPEGNLHVNSNEIGQMARLANDLTRNMANLNQFANQLSKGNLSIDYKLVGENDLLGKALINLRNSLIITKEEDEKRKIDDERRNWTNQGHTIFGEILRQRSREVNQLTDDIIKNLVYYLKANQGGLFIINDSSDIPKIELISAFAYDRKKFFERNINIGDGLIGTVALERNTVYLKEIPEDYIEIESGLGESSPKFLLIVPLKFEDDILGIVELASFKEFQDFEIKFVEEVAQSIASTLLTAKINNRTEQLLNESRKQSEELALQEVEARQNIEEMRSAQELAQRREADLSGILSAVDNTLMKGEYELDGTLISVNNRHLQTMGYQLKEIKGKNIEIFIPKDELEHFRKVWANVVAGNPRQLEVRRRTKTGEILWLINQYTPVNDISGKISKILYLAHDITKYKKSEEESVARTAALELKDEELQKQIKELRLAKELLNTKENELTSIFSAIDLAQVAIELDTTGYIQNVNNQLLQIFSLTESDLIGKNFVDIFISDKTDAQFKAILEKLNQGTATSLISRYTLPNKANIWLSEIYTPIINANNETTKILIIANDITEQKELEQIKANLIKEAQALSEELKKKDKEIAENVKTITKLPEDSDKKTYEYYKIIEVLNQTLPRIETDLEFNIISANKKFTEMYKYPERELINKHLSRIVPVKEKELLAISSEEFQEGKPIEIQLHILAKDKQVFPVIFNILPFNIGEKSAGKIIIYISGGDFSLVQLDDIDGISDELKTKKLELKELTEKLDQLRKQEELQKLQSINESDSDELYSKWIQTLKSENDNK